MEPPPDPLELSPAVRAFVEAQPVARLATVDPAGAPHIVPICFVLLGGRCYSVVDEKPKRHARLQRLRNIEAHHAATLLCDIYSDDWEHLAWAMLRCHADVLAEDREGYEAALDALRAKYPQYRSMALDGRPLVALTPLRVSSWGIEGRTP